MHPKLTDTPYAEERLREMLAEDAGNWNPRKALARLLFERGQTREAAELVWNAPEIPSIDFELAFAARILAKGLPRRAIRLLHALLEQNRGKPAQNLGLANALLHHGMVMQAARFYGAAIEADPDGEMLNADLEHFLVWVDDHRKLWGEFEDIRDELDELPWIRRDDHDAKTLKDSLNGHTTPITVPGLPQIPAEDPEHTLYIQSPRPGAEPTPPPSVTIPLDRVAAKDRLFDEKRGAQALASAAEPRRNATSPAATRTTGGNGATPRPTLQTSGPVPVAPQPKGAPPVKFIFADAARGQVPKTAPSGPKRLLVPPSPPPAD